ncbi:MAG TPA: DUF2058 family protein [Vulgatibacter sp.]
MQSLRDKLLQAGLVSQDQAKKAEEGPKGPKGPSKPHERPKQAAPRRQQPASAKALSPAKPLSPEEQKKREEDAAFRERERMLNREREENRKRAAEDRKKLDGLREASEKHEVTERGDEAFHFTTRKKKVQRIYLTPAQLQRLEAGDLAIIDKPLPGELSWALVTREGAERALALDPKALRFYNRGFGQTFGFKAEAPPPGADLSAEGDVESDEEAPAGDEVTASEAGEGAETERATAAAVEPSEEATAEGGSQG